MGVFRSGSTARANPKSQIFRRQLELTSRFPGFRSLWMIPAECRYRRPTAGRRHGRDHSHKAILTESPTCVQLHPQALVVGHRNVMGWPTSEHLVDEDLHVIFCELLW